ncbi:MULTISPECIES: MobH family relaxase [Pseudomonadaceae]|uniref:TraI domain-containing protein n=1 Tax=Stutzerimonas chloritidismutans TaxID=203192 RepID=A0ACC5VP50_STUCH|nr:MULTISPECIES: MobH family relaxase [Pseudomonadaceae]MBX7274278.1 TraI domain-containing protein [Stutzerimonas chloritidismutans]MCS7968174.1 TraI domain-containing protein [Pseudomonas aeruginosa]MCS8138427.1 TraI domain-containing protein [Pseudomonas aeruginosa]MCS8180752.1 TraI domain-containing protein [Pseudomonas aeruginosa]MCS8193455.1 TraI domain-containing protein [Pseudomonas aeruginosa]
MLSLFQPQRASPTTGAPSTPAIEPAPGLTQPQSASSLLATPRRQRLLEHIWQRTSLSRQQFTALYLAPLERYAELVQLFPASESHHHAYPGGMLDHGLEIVAYALKLRQSYLLPTGTTPEDQVIQAEAWTAALAYAALLHDIGKVAVDLHVEYNDGSTWYPWHGPLARPYRFRYRQDREYRLHSAATGLLYRQVLDEGILDWLSQYSPLWSALLYVLAGQYEHAGVLGELVIQADRASVAQTLGGDPARAMAAPKHALQRKLLDGLRYLLKEELKLNQPGASDGWLTQDALWLVSKTVSDKLRAHLLAQGIDGIPANNTAVFNVLQDHGMLQPTPDGKAIWRATVTSDTDWSHSFTLLRLAPALIWEGDDRPAPFTGTVTIETGTCDASVEPPNGSDDTSLEVPSIATPSPEPITDGVDDLLALLGNVDTERNLDEMVTQRPLTINAGESPAPALESDSAQHHPMLSSTENERHTQELPSGEHFMVWLRHGIHSRKLIINDSKALVHTVANTVFLVSPGVFQRYAQEHLQTAVLANQEQIADWQWVQKQFEKLKLHRKQKNGLNIWTCLVTGPRKSRRLHGYLLSDPQYLAEEIPHENPYLQLSRSVSSGIYTPGSTNQEAKETLKNTSRVW